MRPRRLNPGASSARHNSALESTRMELRAC